MIVDYGDLEPSDDHLTLTYHGADFTGTAVEKDQHGKVISEVAFRDGKKYGLCREWFPSGSARAQETYAFGVLHGESREWHENGALRSRGVYELGICLHKQDCSDDGSVINEKVLTEDSPQYRILQLLRASSLGRRAPRVESTSTISPAPHTNHD
jgi:antitoxin component YwqK of YwqJK toxin-antitoxin module